MENHPGQHIPLTNQPHIHPDLSLGALTLYLLITSTLTTTPLSIIGTSGHIPSCIGSMVETMLWGGRSGVRGSGVKSGLGHSGSILLIIYHRSSLTGVIHSGRVGWHLGSENRAGLGDVILRCHAYRTTRSSDVSHRYQEYVR